jgi:hypothetical protein
MLKPLTRSGELLLWADTEIVPGSRWRQDIANAIDRADAAILLVSSDFLASDFIAAHELRPLLSSSRADGLPVLWISVSSSLYENTEIVEYQCLNDPSRPLDTFVRPKARQELKAMAEKVRKILATLQEPSTATTESLHDDGTNLVRSPVRDSADARPNLRILNCDFTTLQAIETCVSHGAPEFSALLKKAYVAARMASDSADRAVPIARHARSLLGNKLSNTRGKTKRRVITSRQNGRNTIEQLGMVIWDSGDEYAGQIRGKLENGLGVYKIYSATLDFDPNAVNTYEGDMSAGHFGQSRVVCYSDAISR